MKLVLPSRLSGKLLAAILPPIVLAVSLIVWLQYNLARGEILREIDQQIALLAKTTAGNIDGLLEQRYSDLFTLAESPMIADYYRNVDFQLLDEAETYRREFEHYLSHFAARSRAYARILYLDRRGRVVCRIAPGAAPGAPAGFTPADFAAAAGAPDGWWTSPIENLAGVGPVLYFAKPVRDELGELKGMLVLGYDLAQLRELLAGIQVGKRGRAFIRAADGVTLEGRPSIPDAEMLVASRALSRRPWTVFVEAPLEDFLGPLRAVKNAATFTALLGGALLVAILLLLVRSITRPIEALVAAARAIGAGDLAHRIAAPGKDELGTLSSAFNDMAEHLDMNRKQTAQLQSQLIQAEKLSAVGQLISSVAHELNNPLAAISGYVQMAQLDASAGRLKDDLAHVYSNVLRCRKVVDNLLFFVRQSGQERSRIELNAAVSAALELLEYRLLKTEDVRVIQTLGEPSPVVAGDLQQIVQVLVNLIANACDAMEGFVPYPDGKTLTLRTGVRGPSAYIEIEDNGPGVAPEQFERIFEPFFTTKAAGRGTGLGLPICRQIVQAHGGDIVLSSRPGAGCVFRVELPLGSPADFERIEAVEPPTTLAAVPGKRVLVADDEKDIAEVIARLLREDGDEVRIAHHGGEALKLLEADYFDLVVSDIEMERAKGTDLYAALASKGAFPRVKMLFVTGDILNPQVLEFLSRTKSDYLVKPFDIQEIRQAMRRLLAGG